MTSGINEANSVTGFSTQEIAMPQRLQDCPDDMTGRTQEVVGHFTRQFGTQELMAWAEWYFANRKPNSNCSFEYWWSLPGKQIEVLDKILMTGVGCSAADSTIVVIRLLLEWYLLDDPLVNLVNSFTTRGGQLKDDLPY